MKRRRVLFPDTTKTWSNKFLILRNYKLKIENKKTKVSVACVMLFRLRCNSCTVAFEALAAALPHLQ